MVIVSGNSQIKIAGNITGSTVICSNNGVFVNGKKVTGLEIQSSILEIRLEGDVASIETDASVTVHGHCKGDIKASGSVQCEDIGGSVNAGGNVKCGKVSGSVNAGGSVRCG